MRLNSVRLDEPVRPRGRQQYPYALFPPPSPPPLPPGLGRRLKRLIQEDVPVYLNELELYEYLQLVDTPQLHATWLQQFEPEEFGVGPKPYPGALFPRPSPPGTIPIPPPRLARAAHEEPPLEFTRGPRPYPLALHPTAPPQFLAQSAGLVVTVTFGSGTLGASLQQLYSLIINVDFGDGALTVADFTLFINGADRTDLLLVNTLQVTNPLSQVSTAQFGLWDPTGNPAALPQVGQEVAIYRKNTRVFGGYVEKPAQAQYMASPGSAFAGNVQNGSGGSVQASDFSSMLDRRYVGKYYDAFLGGSLQVIVADIVNTFLAGDGFSYNTIDGDPGVALGNQLFDWVTIRQAFNTLSSLTGWDFNVDPFKVIRFFPHGAGLGAAPFNIADNDGHTLAESMIVTYDRSTYRNRQGVRSASQQGSLWTDIFSVAQPGPYRSSPQPPDGVRYVFFTLYPINATPIVKVNGVQQLVVSIFDRATTPGWQWFWNPPQGGFTGGLFVEQNTSQPRLTASDVLTVGYPTSLSPIVWAENDAQIAARAAIEGNSGIYEDVQDAPTTMTDPAAQLLYAEALLARYGAAGIPYVVEYMTDVDGLVAGQHQAIQQTTPPVNLLAGLISQVQMKDVDKTFLRYTVQVESGEYLGRGAAQFFAAVVLRGQQPQPANRATYTWDIAPTIPGVSNPGVTGGYVSTAFRTVQHATELLLYLQVYLPTPAAGGTFHIAILQNASGIIAVDFAVGQSGLMTAYGSNLILGAGDSLRVEVDGGGGQPIKDLAVTVVTAVLVN